jgi:hypothetical protein
MAFSAVLQLLLPFLVRALWWHCQRLDDRITVPVRPGIAKERLALSLHGQGVRSALALLRLPRFVPK